MFITTGIENIRLKLYANRDIAELYEILLVPLTLISISFLPLLLVLYFLSEPRFNYWLRLTKWYVPISIAIIAFFPGIDGSLTGFDREFMTWFSTGLYFLLSVIAIARRPKLA
jgi:hypothetical protein